MTININGNQTDIRISIVTDGEKYSIMATDKNGISVKTGKISIKGEENPMIKTKIIETTEKYDKDGKLVEKITREETSEDYETRGYFTTTNPCIVSGISQWCGKQGRDMMVTC